MKINKKQIEKIKNLMLIEREPAKISNQQFLNGLLYIIENGYKWRALPKEFGNWHMIYMRFSRWTKSGTIQRIFQELQKQNLIDIKGEILCLDRTSIKVHPNASGARKTSGDQSIGRSNGD